MKVIIISDNIPEDMPDKIRQIYKESECPLESIKNTFGMDVSIINVDDVKEDVE